MRLIDADALIKKMKHWKEHEVSDGLIGEGIKAGYDAAMICVSEMPTVEKHGHWIGKPIAGYSLVRCSVCFAFANNIERWNYCPNCGAKMDEEVK